MDEKLSNLLDKILDIDYGIIRYIAEAPIAPDEPNIFITIAEFQDPLVIAPCNRDNFTIERKSAGAALDRISAMWAAVGEGIERYAAAIYDPEDIIMLKSSHLKKGTYVHPNDFILFNEEQYASQDLKYNAHNPEISIGWIEALNLSNNKNILFPAALAYFAYKHIDKTEYITDSYSTGLACGPTKEWAICGGLCEAIERDSYSLHWAARQSPKKIPMEKALENANPALKKLLQFKGVDLFIGDITTELGIPSILVVAKQHGKAGIALGASTNLCAKKALEKATVECFHTLNWCQEMRHRSTRIEKEEIKLFSDHVKYYLDEENEKKATFLWNSDEVSDLFENSSLNDHCKMNHKEQSKFIINKLTSLGHTPYLINNTPNDIKELGLHVVKIAVPSFQTMWCGHNRAPLDRRRFNQFLKHKKRELNTPINIDIHPFP